MSRLLSSWKGWTLRVWLLTLTVIVSPQAATAQDAQDQETVQGLGALLQSIHPYLPSEDVSSEIRVFGSTSMDRLAHGWALGFQRFHPQAKVTISTEGSETAFEQFTKAPNGVAMLSRAVTDDDLARLKKLGMKQPAVVFVAREPLAVFVHPSNPLQAIDYETLAILFCKSKDSDDQPITWGTLGLDGELEEKPIKTVGRGTKSGTFTYVKNSLFRQRDMRPLSVKADNNYEVVSLVSKSPEAVAISGLRRGGHKARVVPLKANGRVIPTDDRSLLSGRYPMMRPFCLVFDLGQQGETATAYREFVRYAITQAGQNEAVLAGFLPYDPETLRAQELQLGLKPPQEATGDNRESESRKEASDPNRK